MLRVLKISIVLTLVFVVSCAAENSGVEQSGDDSPGPIEKPQLSALDPTVRTWNKRPIPPREGAFRFLAIGHLYGTPSSFSPRPARSFQLWTSFSDEIGSFDFLAALGDTVWSPNSRAGLEKSLQIMSRLEIPILAIPGNHDLSDAEVWWRKNLGPLYHEFQYGVARFIVLDTETKPWLLGDEQLKFLKKALKEAARDSKTKVVFILNHKVVWGDHLDTVAATLRSNGYPELKAGMAHADAQRYFPLTKTYRRELIQASRRVPIHWISGDCGAFASYQLTWYREPKHAIHYACVGIGDKPGDGALAVTISEVGEVDYKFLPFDGSPPEGIEPYHVDHLTKKKFPGGVPMGIRKFLR